MENFTANPYDDVILPEDFDTNPGLYTGESDEEGEEVIADTTAETTPALEAISAEEPIEEVAEPTTPLPVEKPQTLTVKYNHEVRELPLDEAAIYAQKGMNYDKLDEKVKAYEAREAKSARLATQLGYKDADEMIEAAAKNYRNRQVRELVEAGNTQAMAEFLVDQQLKAKAAEVQVQEPPQSTPTPEEPKSTISPERKAEIDEFVKLYPGVTKLPEEVLRANHNGIRLSVAYEQYRNKAALDELAILKQNQAAAAKAPVSGTAGKAPVLDAGKADPFIAGFDSEF